MAADLHGFSRIKSYSAFCSIRENPCSNRWPNSSAKQIRPGPATRAALLRGSLLSPSRSQGAASRRRWSDSAHAECHIYQRWVQTRGSENREAAFPAAADGPTRSMSGPWRRPQCPGNRYALARVSNFPRQLTLENCRLPPASPQSSFSET